ncbi:MAG: ABC transporter substrate-binding protein, partial [Candidatus Bipolaricaulia bacterium]
MRTMGRKLTGQRYWLSCFTALGVVMIVLGLGFVGSAQGTFRVGMLEPIALDPATISGDAEIAIANAVYDYLVDIGPDNQTRPRLATLRSISEDGLSYAFTLAEGVHFHDGSPLVPGDVVWTFDRLRDPALGFDTTSLYANIDRIDVTGPSEVTFR